MFEKLKSKPLKYRLKLISKFLMIICNIITGILAILAGVGVAGALLSPPVVAGVAVANVSIIAILKATDKFSSFLEKYSTDNEKLSVKLDQMSNFISDLNSVKSELSARSVGTEPINSNTTINLRNIKTPRFKTSYNKTTNEIIIEEDPTDQV